MKYNDLVQCCERLQAENIPADCWDDDGQITGHWSGTLDEMQAAIGRSLTDVEVTCLSLGRCFGPTPVVADPTELWAWIWPDGNGRGSYYEWGNLAERLRSFAE